jgi:hypothetical protein
VAVEATGIRPERELLITAPAVVDSPRANYPGPWSFGGLVEQLVGKENASMCVREWLRSWIEPNFVNEQVVSARTQIEEKIIRPWQERDGVAPVHFDAWEPQLANAPFRLLAIVNRMDLCAADEAGTVEAIRLDWKRHGREKEFQRLLDRSTGTSPGLVDNVRFGYGGGSFVMDSFGEGRLVFGAVDAAGAPLPGDWTVIFEYKLPGQRDENARADKAAEPLVNWAKSWHALGEFDPSDQRFANQLEDVTRKFTDRSTTPDTPMLGQVRTSEAAFGAGREFRQYAAGKGGLKLTTLAQTPAPDFLKAHSREERLLGQFLHDQSEFILLGLHNLPVALPDRSRTMPLLAASAVIPPKTPDFHWDGGTGVSRDARRIFSLNTCTGCHAGETGCGDGLHIHPRAEGEAARTSDFLRVGAPLRVADPGGHGSMVEYREMEDRAEILAALLESKDRTRLNALRDVLRGRLRRAH